MPTEEECKQAVQYREDFWLNLMYALQLVFSLFACITILGVIFQTKWSKMSGIFNTNLKTLLLVGALLIFINSLIAIGFYSYLLVNLIFLKTADDQFLDNQPS